MTGRRSLYTAEIAERILAQLADGRRLRDICADPGMPCAGTVWHWVTRDREGFAARYRQAQKFDKAGPSSLYSAGMAERILQQRASGRALADICRDPGMPPESTVRQWAKDNREGFAARYRQARQIGGTRSGGPTVYTAELAEQILEQLCEGRTLADVCRDPGMPVPSTVRNWARASREGFAEHYKQARWIGYYIMLDQILEIADDSRNDWTVRRGRHGKTEIVPNHENISRSRQRIVARVWLLSKALPRNYGDRRNLFAQLETRDTLTELMKEIEQRNRVLAKDNERFEKTSESE